jgi:hypothetical protein
MEILIRREEFERMKRGVEYELVPMNEMPGYEWKVKGRVVVR